MSHFHFKAKSGNAKTGAMPVTSSSRDTCPPACPFLQDGSCYANHGPLSWFWNKLTAGINGITWKALCALVAALPYDTIWRHNQCGDLPGKGNRINAKQVRALVEANTGKRGFTFTHKPLTPANQRIIKHANANGFTINLSANNAKHADTLAALGIGPVAVVLPIGQDRNSYTPDNRPIVVCPATRREDITCKRCGLCSIANRKVIVGFPAHGAGKRKAEQTATA